MEPQRTVTLTPDQLTLLQVVHDADAEEGGLSTDDVDDDDREALEALVANGLLEEHLEDAGDAWVKITARGVETLQRAVS
jgi:hypothetical protein